MDIEIEIIPPKGQKICRNLIPELMRSLNRMQVAYRVKESSSENIALQLIDTSENEQQLVVRLLLRAGYDIIVPT